MSDIQDLLWQARQLEHGPERVALVEEAIRAADLAQDDRAGYEARQEMIQSASYAGQGEKMLVAFTWCRAKADAQPEERDWGSAYMLLWYQKWVLGAVTGFPQIPLARIEALLDDYAARLQAGGYGPRSLHEYRLRLAQHLGNRQVAAQHFDAWQAERRDGMSNCHACELNAVANHHLFMHDDEQGLHHGETLIRRQMGCAHVPHTTLASILRPLMRQGRWADAEKYHQRGRRMVSGKPNYLYAQARHLEYLALVRPARALPWYARHLPWAERTGELDDRLNFHMAAALLFAELHRAGRQSVRLTLPQDVPGYQIGGRFRVQERFEHHHDEALRLAALFDRRNGTAEHTSKVEISLKLADLPRPATESQEIVA